MLKIVVVDRTAESRSRIVAEIGEFLRSEVGEINLLPQVSLKPLAIQELKFHGAPDICIIGTEIVLEEMTEVGAIRKLLPDSAIIVRLNSQLNSLAIIEQIARFGADDTISDQISAPEFLRKLILLARRVAKPKSGTMILVDSGKGGLGVTSIAAGFAEALSSTGKRVLAVDLDIETQDLSRFLQAKPFINDNLQLLFNQSRPITQEFVEQCYVQVWSDNNNLFCLPPTPESDDIYDGRGSYARLLLQTLEILDTVFDYVVIDVGSIRGAMLKTLYRVADKVVYLVSNDPATLYASVDRLTRVRPLMAPAAQLLLLENNGQKTGLSNELLKTEFLRAAKLDPSVWCTSEVSHCKNGAKWPASGMTLFSAGRDQVARGISAALSALGLFEDQGEQGTSVARNLIERTSGLLAFIRPQNNSAQDAPRRERRALPAVTSAAAAPQSAGNFEKESALVEEMAPLINATPLGITDQGMRFSKSGTATTEKITNELGDSDIENLISGAQIS